MTMRSQALETREILDCSKKGGDQEWTDDHRVGSSEHVALFSCPNKAVQGVVDIACWGPRCSTVGGDPSHQGDLWSNGSRMRKGLVNHTAPFALCEGAEVSSPGPMSF